MPGAPKGSGKDIPASPMIEYSPVIDTIRDTTSTLRYQATGPLEETYESRPIEMTHELSKEEGRNKFSFTDTVEDSMPVDMVLDTYEDTTHHANLIEFDEETMQGSTTGEVSDHTTVEDTMEWITENHLIDFDATMNPNVNGAATGVLEEITDTHTYDEMHELGTEHGSSQSALVEEEDTYEPAPHIEIGAHVIDDFDITSLGEQSAHQVEHHTFEEDTIDDVPHFQMNAHSPLVIDVNTQSHVQGQHMGIQSTEEDTSGFTIGDFVWIDGDHNGVQNDGEVGLGGVFIILSNEKGEVIATTTSDEHGHYAFHHVKPGKYQIDFTTPNGYEPTSKHTTARTDKDSDGRIAHITVTGDDHTIDAGFFPLKNWGGEEPKKPEQPEMPQPEKPEMPEQPEEPQQPEVPEQPEVPQQPEVPEHPEKPQHPEVPQQPEVPEQPNMPQQPKVPVQPEKPDMPKQPVQPQQPNMPVQPNMPKDKSISRIAESHTKQPIKPAPNQPSQSAELATLPETGTTTTTPTHHALLGGLLSILGIRFLLRRRKANRS